MCAHTHIHTITHTHTHTHTQICKEADGYQPHVMAPESGIRRLGSDALDLVNSPVNAAVQQVYTLLVNAARCA